DMRHALAGVEQRHDDPLDRNGIAAAKIEMDGFVSRHLLLDATAIRRLERAKSLRRIVLHQVALERFAEPRGEAIAKEHKTEAVRLDRGGKAHRGKIAGIEYG